MVLDQRSTMQRKIPIEGGVKIVKVIETDTVAYLDSKA